METPAPQPIPDNAPPAPEPLPKQKLPILRILTIISLIILFIFFLWPRPRIAEGNKVTWESPLLIQMIFSPKTEKVLPPEEIGEEVKEASPSPILQQYTCPETEWVDCMPGPDAGVKQECTPEFLEWAKENCPNFKGAAL